MHRVLVVAGGAVVVAHVLARRRLERATDPFCNLKQPHLAVASAPRAAPRPSAKVAGASIPKFPRAHIARMK